MNNQLKYTAFKTKKSLDASPNTHKVDRFNIMLYIETADYCVDSVLEKVRSNEHIGSYAYILHNKDFYTEETFDRHGNLLGHLGEMKKPHYHVTVSLNSKYTISDIGIWLGIPQRFIEKCKSFEGSVLYLTHRNAPEKVPYPKDNIITNVKGYCNYLYDNYEPKESPISSLWSYLDQCELPTVTGFIKYFGNDRVPELVKYWSMIKSVIDEHKSKYLEKVEELNKVKEDNMRYQDSIVKLCKKFGKVSVEDTGYDGKQIVKEYTLNENGDIDLLGFRVGGNE